nr:DUF547 domain-containing protein [Spirosoma rhododendri]
MILPLLAQAGSPPSHAIWDGLLKKHVDGRGLVDYKGLKRDEALLNQYLDLLSRTPPAASWSVNEKMAYWINAYNAFTVRLILNHYPLKSIKDIGPAVQIPFVNTPWTEKFFTIGGQKMSLDNIEHGTLRKQFTEPRIHFALVCAARSCPRLRNEAYTPARLAGQLNEQGVGFLNDPTKNAVTPGRASLSKLFDWYNRDFEKNSRSVVYWVNRYSQTKINADTPVSYLDYDWRLNEQ